MKELRRSIHLFAIVKRRALLRDCLLCDFIVILSPPQSDHPTVHGAHFFQPILSRSNLTCRRTRTER
ncbi:hypothetical protein CC80DRAFT_497502 [Byssothecium circinans]|uniref:Uncharacterized protein n=1 Tax=Byssothecium circinans TaxID=147558 RepID=A0A6A5TFB7_9PLEO|nr:hypothetical protein CC80DRAFT_497502 [Byssothecium circinans]